MIHRHIDDKLSSVGAKISLPDFCFHHRLIVYGCTNRLIARVDQTFLSVSVKVSLTERIDVFSDCEREAAACVVNAKEDHGHVLRGAHASPRRSRVAEVHVAFVQRQRVILGAGELLAFHHPAVKHLQGTRQQQEFRFRQRLFGFISSLNDGSVSVHLAEGQIMNLTLKVQTMKVSKAHKEH